MSFTYDPAGNRVFYLNDEAEEFTYVALDEAAVLLQHALETPQLATRGGYRPGAALRVREVPPQREIAIRFDNLHDALTRLGPRVVPQLPPGIAETGSIVLRMAACAWARSVEPGKSLQIGSSVF